MRVSLAMVVLMGLCAVVRASATPAQVAEWVEQLNAPTAAARTAAMEQLRSAGPEILPWLPETDQETAPAVRAGITRLREHLERALAAQSVLPGRVTWAGDTTFEAALATISRQTQNPLEYADLDPTVRDRRWSVDWRETSFWEAISASEQSGPIEWRWSNERERYLAQPSPRTLPARTDAAGPARFVLDGAKLKPLHDHPTESLLRCAARLQLEPRLRPLFAQVKMTDWTVSADGRPMKPWNPAADYELSFPDRTSEITLPLDFRWTAAPQTRWRIHGKVTVHLAAGREELSFAGPTLVRGAISKRGGVSARVQEARFEDDPQGGLRARIRIVVNYERGGPAFESHRVGLFHRSAWLSDRKDARLPAADFEITAEVDGGLGIEYRFERLPGKPVDYRFSYEAPTLLLAVPLDFSLVDLDPPVAAAE
ncbi:MAG: hypothetical protein SFV23_14015 [Planctomycetaceae bacterium]|nr:hypothetical protein [Planctomycetaceae bacterium]